MSADLPDQADVVIIGGGPAGLAAATELRAEGVARVVVLEREANAGGIPRHCGHYPYGLREFRRLLRGPDYAARLVASAMAAGVGIHTGITVTALHPGPRLAVTGPTGPGAITARAVLLATGAREASRAQRLIGGTKPGGVLSTGALQGLVYLDGLRPFRRPVVLGSELVAFSALMTCRHLGIAPVAMIEPGSRPIARWPAAVFPRLLGIPVLLDTAVVAIEGRDQVTGIVVSQDGRERRIAADGVIVSGGFRPEAALLAGSHLASDRLTGGPSVDQFGRCSDRGYFAAGNLLRPIETAGWCWAEGRAAGRVIARALAGGLPSGEDHAVSATGEGLRYLLPQRLTPENDGASLPEFQVRLTRSMRGNLMIRAEGMQPVSYRITSRPERRITIPLPKGIAGPVTITLEPEP